MWIFILIKNIICAFKEKSENDDANLPHQKYPELLLWKKHDMICEKKYTFREYSFVGFGSNKNIIILQKRYTSELIKFRVDYVMNNMYNHSIQQDDIRNDLKLGEDYMKFLEDFQKAYMELQARK